MSKILKALMVLVVVAILAVVGLNIALRTYLNQERIRSLVIPPAEKGLQRKVSFQEAHVNLFKGVVIRGLTVKEADGREDFLRIKEFVLKYRLLPLLKKEIVISKILLVDPYVRIYRDARGHFNYETLGPLKKEKGRASPAKKGRKAGSPWPLTIHSIRVKRAHVVVKDALGEIPDTDLSANANVALSMAASGAMSFSGKSDFLANVVYGQEKSQVKGNLSFTPEKLTYKTTIQLEGDTITLSGQVVNYSANPSIILNIFSPLLHLDRLMRVPDRLPKGKTPNKKSPGTKGGNPSPPGLKVKGEYKIREATYKGLKMEDLQGNYEFKNGIFTLRDAVVKMAQGAVKKNLQVNLNPTPMTYKGDVRIQDINMGILTTALMAKGKGMVTGRLDSDITFSGKGAQWERAKRFLTAKGTFALKDGQFLDFPALNKVAGLLNLEELKNLAFKEIEGNFKVEKGKVLLKSALTSQDVKMKAQGTVGLDGALNLPLVLKLSPKLGDKLKKRVSFARYLAREKGWTVVPIRLTGSLSSPIPTPELGNVKGRLQGEATKAIQGVLTGKKGKGEKENPLQGIKKLFGK